MNGIPALNPSCLIPFKAKAWLDLKEHKADGEQIGSKNIKKHKRVTLKDIDILTKTRTEVLKAANQLSADTDMSEVKRQSYDYYKKFLLVGSHIAYLVLDESRFVGTGALQQFYVRKT